MPGQSWHDRLFRALLRAFPAEFRERFGREMAGDFQDQLDEARERGPRRLLRLWCRTGRDLLWRAPGEHLDILRRDIVFTTRLCRRHPTLTVTIVATIAAAVGLNTAVFSVVDGVLLRSLPYDDDGRLVRLYQLSPDPNRPRDGLSAPNFADVRSRATRLDAVALLGSSSVTVTGGQYPERVDLMTVSEDFFRLFPVQPVLGRLFAPSDYTGSHRAIVLTHALWQRQFGGRDDAIGSVVSLPREATAEVVGVLPPDFGFQAIPGRGRVEGWISEVSGLSRTQRFFVAVGRLADGATIDAARIEMDVIADALAREYPKANAGRGIAVASLHETMVEDVRTQVGFLFGAAFCVLLVACANIANLLLAFQAGRRHDLATRVALGASRARLIRQFVTHSLLLSIAGGIAGVLAAIVLVPSIVAAAPTGIPRLDTIAVDGRVLLFSIATTTLLGVVCGLVPCLVMGRRTTTNVLRSTGVDARDRGRRVRHGLAVAQVALALMLVVAAGLMVRTIRAVGALELGFDPARVISIGLAPDWAALTARGLRPDEFASTFMDRIRALPGVEAAGFGPRPLGGPGNGMVVKLPDGESRAYRVDTVGPGYLEALGATLLEGRFFTPFDRGDRRDVAIVNQAAVRAGWVDGYAIGGHVFLDNRQLEVVGLLRDVRRDGLERSPTPMVYLPGDGRLTPVMSAYNILIRTSGDPEDVLPAARAIVRDIDPTSALMQVQTLAATLADAQAPRRFTLELIGVFSLIALGLSALGVYGLVSDAVSRRVPEFGIRLALGATPARILLSIVRYGAAIVVIGAAIGLAGAVALNRTMQTLVFGVETTDVVAYVSASVVLMLATLAACLIPARRAASVDPVRALRQE